MYATIADLRAEGVSESKVSDSRLAGLIEEASLMIEKATRWFFAPRVLTYRLDGRGTSSIEPPAPAIRLDRLSIDGALLAPQDLIIVGAPVQTGFDAPRITLRHGRFPRGYGNVEAFGLWGYTEHDGSPEGRTPLEIRRACMMMVLRLVPVLADTDAIEDTRNRWRVVEERTREQSYKLDRPGAAGPLTGDPDIDRIVLRYRRPPRMGAA